MSDAEQPTLPQSHRQTLYAPPPGATEFVLIRHGASAAFRSDAPFALVDGHGDPELAPDGLAQAELVADRLVNERVDAVYVSNLQRTRQTIQPYLDRTGKTATVKADLREVFLGDYEGGRVRELVASGDPIWQRMQATGNWGEIPGAESSDELMARTVGVLKELHPLHPDQRVVCVAHGGVIAQIARYVTGSPMRYSWGADNASMHSVVVLGDDWRLRRFNDISHLATFVPEP